MGSLMAGWASPSLNTKAAKHQRNKSSTKEEIDAYWRLKKQTEEDVPASSESNKVRVINDPQVSAFNKPPLFHRSNSFPMPDGKGNFLDVDSKIALEKIRAGWWTRSNWAFLNDPPVIATEGPSYKYASQYHVTKNLNSDVPDTHPGIST